MATILVTGANRGASKPRRGKRRIQNTHRQQLAGRPDFQPNWHDAFFTPLHGAAGIAARSIAIDLSEQALAILIE